MEDETIWKTRHGKEEIDAYSLMLDIYSELITPV